MILNNRHWFIPSSLHPFILVYQPSGFQMLHRLLTRLVQEILKNPKRIVVSTILPCLLCSSFLLSAKVDFSFLALMPVEDPLLVKFQKVAEEVAINNQLLLLLEDDSEESLDACAQEVLEELWVHPDVQYAISRPSQQWIEENLAWIANEEDLKDLLEIGNHITNTAKLNSHQKRILELEQSQEGFRVLSIGLTKDPLDVNLNDVLSSNSPFDRVEQTTETILQKHNVEGGYAGLAAISAQDQHKTITSITKFTPISLILVLLLLRLVEPRIKRLMTLALPMLLSFGTTLGLTSLLLGEINFIEGFFGVMIFGLGVDFGLHLLVRMREEQQQHSFDDALLNTILGAGPAIVAGAITTIGAFSLIGLAEDPVAKHLGVSAAIGLLTCLILMLTLLPAIWVLMVRNETNPSDVPPFEVPFLGGLTQHAVRYPKSWIGGFGLWVLIALVGTTHFRFESDLENLFNRDVPATQYGDKIYAHMESNTTPWVFLSDSLEDARDIQQKIAAEPLFARSVGASDLFSTPLEERHAYLTTQSEQLRKQQNILQAFVRGPVQWAMPAQQALELLKHVNIAIEQGPPRIEDLPDDVRYQITTQSGRWITYAYGHQDQLNSQTLHAERLAAEAIQPEVAGVGNFIELAMDFNRPWVVPTITSVLFFVVLVLLIDLRNLKWIVLALTPVTISVLIAFGMMCWLNVGFSVLLIIVVPLLLGLGVDDGLHVVHRMRENKDLSASEATLSVSKAIVMTTLTTSVSFGVLLFSNHPGIESMSLALLLGLPLCLLTSTTVLPALKTLLFPTIETD